MSLFNDEIITMLRESADNFLVKSHDSKRMKGEIGQVRLIDRSIWSEMAELGWLSLGLPESSGGSGLSLAAAACLSEQFGRRLLPEPYIASVVMPIEILNRSRSKELQEMLGSGKRPFSLAWQEENDCMDFAVVNSNIANGHLNGNKGFVPSVEDDSNLLTTVNLEGTFAIVNIGASHESVEVKRQAAGIGSVATLGFDNVAVTDEPLLVGDEAKEAIQAALEAGRVCSAANLCGLADGALKTTLEYLRNRVQFDRPIGSFQTIQHRCVDLKIAVSLAGASWREALQHFEREPLSVATATAISAAQARCAATALKVCKEAVQMHGAMGFTEEADIGLFLRAALFGESWLGSTVDHRRRFLAGRKAEEICDG